MKKRWAKRLAAAMLAGGALFGMAAPQADAADIRILPVDTAKFWAGAHFDFDVEVSNAKNLGNVSIQINGQDANKFFGKALERKDLGNGVTSFRVNDVSFPKTGTYKIDVTASDATGSSAKSAGTCSPKAISNSTTAPTSSWAAASSGTCRNLLQVRSATMILTSSKHSKTSATPTSPI